MPAGRPARHRAPESCERRQTRIGEPICAHARGPADQANARPSRRCVHRFSFELTTHTSPTKKSQDPQTRSWSEDGAAGAELGADGLGDVEGEDLGAVLVEVEAVVGPHVLALP